jgi:hypothetical protein
MHRGLNFISSMNSGDLNLDSPKDSCIIDHSEIAVIHFLECFSLLYHEPLFFHDIVLNFFEQHVGCLLFMLCYVSERAKEGLNVSWLVDGYSHALTLTHNIPNKYLNIELVTVFYALFPHSV